MPDVIARYIYYIGNLNPISTVRLFLRFAKDIMYKVDSQTKFDKV